MTPRRIAISTGGGDAPGLNAVIRAIVLSALNRGWECVGIRDGYNGLLAPADYPQGVAHPPGPQHRPRHYAPGRAPFSGPPTGATRCVTRWRRPDGKRGREGPHRTSWWPSSRRQGLDALIAIGGDGSLEIATPCTSRACA